MELSLEENDLSGTLPAELGALTNLEDLLLSENALAGTIPPELFALTKLTQLSAPQLTPSLRRSALRVD